MDVQYRIEGNKRGCLNSFSELVPWFYHLSHSNRPYCFPYRTVVSGHETNRKSPVPEGFWNYSKILICRGKICFLAEHAVSPLHSQLLYLCKARFFPQPVQSSSCSSNCWLFLILSLAIGPLGVLWSSSHFWGACLAKSYTWSGFFSRAETLPCAGQQEALLLFQTQSVVGG